MTNVKKLIDKFKNNPINTRYSEIKKILFNLGFTKRNCKGSHRIFKNKDCIINLAVHNNETKPSLKKMTLKILQHHNFI